MIYVDEQTTKVTLTIIDTASICTVTQEQVERMIDLFITVFISDFSRIATVLGIPDDDNDPKHKHEVVRALYRWVLEKERSSDSRDSTILRRIVEVIEATKLLLRKPALDDLLMFGKAQSQLLDTVQKFQKSHQYEMDKLNLKFDSLEQVILLNLAKNTPRNRAFATRAMQAITDGVWRKIAFSFAAWDTDDFEGAGNWIYELCSSSDHREPSSI